MEKYEALVCELEGCANDTAPCSECPHRSSDENDLTGCIERLELSAADAIRELIDMVKTQQKLIEQQRLKVAEAEMSFDIVSRERDEQMAATEASERRTSLAREAAREYRQKYLDEKKKIGALLDLIARGHSTC